MEKFNKKCKSSLLFEAQIQKNRSLSSLKPLIYKGLKKVPESVSELYIYVCKKYDYEFKTKIKIYNLDFTKISFKRRRENGK